MLLTIVLENSDLFVPLVFVTLPVATMNIFSLCFVRVDRLVPENPTPFRGPTAKDFLSRPKAEIARGIHDVVTNLAQGHLALIISKMCLHRCLVVGCVALTLLENGK